MGRTPAALRPPGGRPMESIEVLEMLTPISICHHAVIRMDTQRPTEFIDLTDRLQQMVARARVHCGVVNVHTMHTTTGIVVNELEPLLLDDFVGAARRRCAARFGLSPRRRSTAHGQRDTGRARQRPRTLPGAAPRFSRFAQRRRRRAEAGAVAACADGRARRSARA